MDIDKEISNYQRDLEITWEQTERKSKDKKYLVIISPDMVIRMSVDRGSSCQKVFYDGLKS